MDMRAYRNAIASIESAGSGDYAAVGPTNERLGRALGRYQIMEANIGPWSREVLGFEVTPEQFMQNPDIQDAIFDGKFGSYVQRFGPEGAAQAWFAGPGGVGKTGRKDVLGTSVGAYGDKFARALGRAGPTKARQQAGAPLATRVPPNALAGLQPPSEQRENTLAQEPDEPEMRQVANMLDPRAFMRDVRPVNRLKFT